MSASTQCPHPDFQFQVNVANIEDDTIKMVDITGHCTICGKAAVFRGVPLGVSWHHPTVSVDGQELRVPMVVDGDEVDENRKRISVSISVPE
ncbi:hypothetical protein LJR231_001540 [Phyllobacterium sp. LjRoot231]|uniref:hypothetical protein n=1 Tax=Phyllobacterium sp. LjRoot231 TaxID=3342289 RepID=UPI003ECEA6D7